MPSRRKQRSKSSFTSSSVSYKSLSSFTSNAFFKVMPNSLGIILAKRFTSGNGISSTRPTSRMTARAASVPKVMICATRSCPYFSVT